MRITPINAVQVNALLPNNGASNRYALTSMTMIAAPARSR